MNKLKSGTSVDAALLTFIKLISILLSMVVTRLLSQELSVYDYGTYSQVLLVVSTVTSLTVLGMSDGVNYFNCNEQDPEKRESYISSIFAMQCIVGTLAGTVVLCLTVPLCNHFSNDAIAGLIFFAAALPLLQNIISMFQVLLVSQGLARTLALRNFALAVCRLVAVVLVIKLNCSVKAVLLSTVLIDIAQVLFFWVVLRKHNYTFSIKSVKFGLFKPILNYCAPMAVFIVINTLNRDCDKYLIGLFTDTETLAGYSNASKMLPFDIIMSAFTTVLLPQITRLVSQKQYQQSVSLYKRFLEISYISTSVMCGAALAVSPQLLELLYSSKYSGVLNVFCIYILVDLIRFTNITLILTASGKTKILMYLGIGTLLSNALLNIVLFKIMGVIGPAVATFVTMLASGIVLMAISARQLKAKLLDFFDKAFFVRFMCETAVLTCFMFWVQQRLATWGMNYILVMVLICALYAAVMLLLHGKRIIGLLKSINK